MLGIANYFVFLTSGILLNITPGADSVFVLSRSASRGRRAGVFSALGIGTGTLIQSALCGLGLAVLLKNSPMAFRVVKRGCTVSDLYGTEAVSHEAKGSRERSRSKGATGWAYYLQGMLPNLLNPAVTLFLFTFLPQFILPDQPYGPLPYFLLGGTLAGTGTIYCVILALFPPG